MLSINQTLQGRYKIVRQLGHGGMGAVYEAIDKRFGEPIALKEIIVDTNNEKQSELISKAFEREAKSLAKAKHEAVPFVRDYFSELNRQFLVMELVEGEDLGEMLEKRNAPFPVEDVVNWMEQLLDALDYLHTLKPPIIHRDIKPQNLKLTARSRIKLLDFGIARSTDKASTVTKQTFVGATLTYSPIEQILRVIDPTFREFIVLKHKDKAELVLKQDTDARCDLYALGGTFFHLLTNHAPIDSTKRTLDLWEGKPDPLPNPVEINPSIPAPIAQCLLKAMSVERKKRFSTALQMQEALKLAVEQSKTSSLELKIKTQADTIIFNSNPQLQIEQRTEVLPSSISTYPPLAQENSSSAKTEVFITAPASTYPPVVSESSNFAPTEVLQNIEALTHQPEAPPMETQYFPQAPAGDQTFVKVEEVQSEVQSEFQSNVDVQNQNLTSVNYLQNIIVDPPKTAPKIPLQTIPEVEKVNSTETNKMLWILPMAMFGFFGFVIVVVFIWFLIPPKANVPVTNTSTGTPVANNPSPTPNLITTQSPSPSDTNSSSSSGGLEVTPTPSPNPSTSSSPRTGSTKDQNDKPNSIDKPNTPEPKLNTPKPNTPKPNTPKPNTPGTTTPKPPKKGCSNDPSCQYTDNCC